eukprot:4387398-Lingulodinium_polyedra.AAC.1
MWLWDFLLWLYPLSLPVCRSTLASLLCFLGWSIERGGFWEACCADPLLAAPVPQGTKRSR